MTDPVFDLIYKEEQRQKNTLTLIASENYASKAVRTAVGSVFMNKYSEGQAQNRYYQGNQIIDKLELECKKRALQTFSLDENIWDVNVQALSGSPANLAVLFGLVEPGETILSLYLPDGGHLSHGWYTKTAKVTLVSTIWNVLFYHVNQKTMLLDYDQILDQAKQVQAKLIISGGTAYPREIEHEKMGFIAKSVGAMYLADVAHEAGLIAGGANSSPFPFADVVTMTTHKTLRGPRGALIFSRKPLDKQIDRAVFPGIQGGPHNHTIAGIAVALREAQTVEFSQYAHQVVLNAKVLADELQKRKLELVSGGTDKHLLLLTHLPSNTTTPFGQGWIAAWALEFAGIIANRNTVPHETSSPFYPSGLRLGTPAVTTRGMKEKEMKKIAKWITQVVMYSKKWSLPSQKDERQKFLQSFMREVKKDAFLQSINKHVFKLCAEFPL